MTKFIIQTRRIRGLGHEFTMAEAVAEVIDREATMIAMGTIETLQAKLELQGKMIARMLMVQFGDYGDEFDAGCAPTDKAAQLEFILNGDMTVREE